MAAVYECERGSMQGGLVATAAVAGAVTIALLLDKECVLSVSGGGRKRRKLGPPPEESLPSRPPPNPSTPSQLTSFTFLRVHAILALVLFLLLWLLLLLVLLLLLLFFLRRGLRLSLVHNGHRLVLGLHALMRIRTTKAALSVHACGVGWTVSSL